jgi:integrase
MRGLRVRVASMTMVSPMGKVRGVYEHPTASGVWWVQYFDHGRRRRERVGRKSDAVKLYAKRKTEILRGDKLPELQWRRVTFGKLLDDVQPYINTLKSKRSYKYKTKLARAAFGTRPAEDIEPGEIERWIEVRGVSNATCNRWRAFFSLVFNEGMRSCKLRANPARLVRQKRETRGRERFLDQAKEYPRLLAAMQEQYPARVPAFIFSVLTGARLGEQFRLCWKGVDFEHRRVTFLDTKNGEDRHVPMSSAVYDLLRALEPKKPQRRALVFGSLQEFCCATKTRRPRKPRQADHKEEDSPAWFRELCEELDPAVDEYTWHNNRHTFCSWLAIAGTPLKTIQKFAGHKSIATTARYAHLSPDHEAIEIERLGVSTPAPQSPKPPSNVVPIREVPQELPSAKAGFKA